MEKPFIRCSKLHYKMPVLTNMTNTQHQKRNLSELRMPEDTKSIIFGKATFLHRAVLEALEPPYVS